MALPNFFGWLFNQFHLCVGTFLKTVSYYHCDRKVTAPSIVVPARQVVTAGFQKSIDPEVFADSLKEFFCHVFAVPPQYWQLDPPNPKLFQKCLASKGQSSSSSSCEQAVSMGTVKVFTYPKDYVYSNNGAPAILLEWEWESVESPDDALNQLRKYYFDSTYIDIGTTYTVVEAFPKFVNSQIASPMVFRGVWQRFGFSKREWIEFIGVDEQKQMVISGSCLHPRYNEHAGLCNKNCIQQLLEFILPVGVVRAKCLYGWQFRQLKNQSTGCLVRAFVWNNMCGPIDVLQALGVNAVLDEIKQTSITHFCNMDAYYKREKDGNPVAVPDISLILL